MEITQTIIVLIFLFLDIVLIAKPFMGLLNIICGFFTILFTMLNIPQLNFVSTDFLGYFVTFMVILGLITMGRGIDLYYKTYNNKR